MSAKKQVCLISEAHGTQSESITGQLTNSKIVRNAERNRKYSSDVFTLLQDLGNMHTLFLGSQKVCNRTPKCIEYLLGICFLAQPDTLFSYYLTSVSS